jgi:rhodanese-related sulfurtransferase
MKKRLYHLLAGLLLNNTLSIAGDLATLTPEQLLDMQKNANALVVDVRTEGEWQSSGVISESRKLQSFDAEGHFDENQWLSDLEKMKSSPDQAVILVCRSGNRSGKIGTLLTKKLGMKNVYHLGNGLQSWTKSGHALSPNCTQIACK